MGQVGIDNDIGALHVTPITAYPTTITTYCSVVANHARITTKPGTMNNNSS